jgi:hypothetical protein
MEYGHRSPIFDHAIIVKKSRQVLGPAFCGNLHLHLQKSMTKTTLNTDHEFEYIIRVSNIRLVFIIVTFLAHGTHTTNHDHTNRDIN